MKQLLCVLAGSFLVFGFLGCEVSAPLSMQNIQDQVAADAVQQYEIAKRQGDKLTICVQAGFVSAAYLQAKDEANYSRWKAKEKSDCAAAGM